MPEVLMNMPELPPGKRYTGEMRQVNQNEQYLAENGPVNTWPFLPPTTTHHPIVVDIYKRPDWMLPGWLCEDHYGWAWFSVKPFWHETGRWVSDGGKCFIVADKIKNTAFDFTPPAYTGGHENSLTEV